MEGAFLAFRRNSIDLKYYMGWDFFFFNLPSMLFFFFLEGSQNFLSLICDFVRTTSGWNVVSLSECTSFLTSLLYPRLRSLDFLPPPSAETRSFSINWYLRNNSHCTDWWYNNCISLVIQCWFLSEIKYFTVLFFILNQKVEISHRLHIIRGACRTELIFNWLKSLGMMLGKNKTLFLTLKS